MDFVQILGRADFLDDELSVGWGYRGSSPTAVQAWRP